MMSQPVRLTLPVRILILPLSFVLLFFLFTTTPLQPDGQKTIANAQTCGKSSNYLAVWEIQGNGDRSPLEGQRVSNVRGIVTADFQRDTGGPWELRGFFVQAHEPDCDDATSDGVFVYTGSSAKNISVGDLVKIDRADVVEYQGPSSFIWERTLTQLDCRGGCNVSTLQSNYGLPDPAEYDPPQNETESIIYNEAREGMLLQVSVDSTVVMAANQYNEVIILRGLGHDRLHRADPPNGHRIMVSGDGLAASQCGQEGLGYIKTFDTMHYDPAQGFAVYGPLTYGFNNYKIHQDGNRYCLQVTVGDDSSYNPANNPGPAADTNTLTIGSMNAWNLFDTVNDPNKNEPVLTQEELDHKSLKLADAICNSHGLNRPLVVALQEIENLTVLEKVAGDVATLCNTTYEAYTLNAPDGRGIQTGYLTRADRVTVLDYELRQACSAVNRNVTYGSGDHPSDVTCEGDTPYYVFNRPPMELVIQVTLADSVRTIYLYNNHFKSKLSSSVCTTSDCTDWRIEEAQHVRNLTYNRLVQNPDAYVIALGDFNDFTDSEPLAIMDKTEGYLVNTWTDIAGPPSTGQGTIQRYSYVFNGQAQTLDHILISDGLDVLPRHYAPRRVNVDWPATHMDDTSMFRSSDHDLLLIGFDFSDTPGDGGGGDTPPSASIVQPAAGSTVSGSVTVQVDASDAEDDTGSLQVEVAINGGSWQTAVFNSSSGYYEWTWDTTATADGSATVDARATDSANNTTQASQIGVTVSNNEGGGNDPVMYVEAIDFDVTVNRGRFRTYDVAGLVTILDTDGNPVANATVDVTWSGAAGGSETLLTNANGVATTSELTGFLSGDTVCLEVTNVTHTDYNYDSSLNNVTTRCITF
jgi:uncharacterized protein